MQLNLQMHPNATPSIATASKSIATASERNLKHFQSELHIAIASMLIGHWHDMECHMNCTIGCAIKTTMLLGCRIGWTAKVNAQSKCKDECSSDQCPHPSTSASSIANHQVLAATTIPCSNSMLNAQSRIPNPAPYHTAHSLLCTRPFSNFSLALPRHPSPCVTPGNEEWLIKLHMPAAFFQSNVSTAARIAIVQPHLH